MVERENYLMLVRGGGDTNIDEVEFVLHNSWYFRSNITACCCRCAGVNLDTSTMYTWILQLLFLVDYGGMVFDGSGEVLPVIEEACYSEVVFCEELDDCWQTKDSWRVLMTEQFNGVGTSITGDDK